jgi:molybdenum cofactor biosynthesis protein B
MADPSHATGDAAPRASGSAAEHRTAAAARPPARVAVVTVSDTRTPDTDTSGAVIRDELAAEGHTIVHHAIVRDEPDQIVREFEELCSRDDVDAIIFNGGTGVAPRDSTVEVIEPLLTKVLPGFGEVFRFLSWHEVGPPAILSRAVGGLRGRRAVFCLPGSRNAVTLAVTKIIRPELAHLLWEARR